MAGPQTTCEWIIEIDDAVARRIVALIDSTVADGGTLGYEKPLDEKQARASVDGLRRQIADGDTYLLMGHENGEPAFMVILTQNRMANCRHRAELSKGVVRPSHRGQGLVRTALRELVRRADELGIEQFVLDVRDGTRAHFLWQHYGFAPFGTLDDYARAGGLSHRGHFMAQTVDSLRQRVF